MTIENKVLERVKKMIALVLIEKHAEIWTPKEAA